MDLFQQFYLLPLFYFVSCMHIRYSTRNWTAASGVSVNRRVRLGGSRQRRVWFCMPETFWRGREREREGHSRHDDGTGSRRRRRRRRRRRQSIEVVRKVGRCHLFPSELKSVSQSVGYAGRQAGRQGKSLEGSRKRKILPVRASHPFRSSRRNLG